MTPLDRAIDLTESLINRLDKIEDLDLRLALEESCNLEARVCSLEVEKDQALSQAATYCQELFFTREELQDTREQLARYKAMVREIGEELEG